MDFQFIVLTFLGSALGGMARYLLSGWVANRFGERFPVGTMVVNVTGAFAIGIVWRGVWEGALPGGEALGNFLIFGFLGGYTTVSSFAWNSLNLFQEREWRRALGNVFGSLFFCLAAVFVGAAAGRVLLF